MAQKDDPISDARRRFLDAVPKAKQGSETISLGEANGRILAKDLSATLDDPPYSRSIMEGFVLCTADVEAASENHPISLEVAGSILVGQCEAKGLAPGHVLQVTTGSFIPEGPYAVVRAWDVQRTDNKIAVSKPAKSHDNIEVQGELRKKGESLFSQGHRITADDIFLLASQGILTVSVAFKPKVALFSSGDEVIPTSEPFRVGAIWDCNAHGLSALIEEAGAEALFQGIAKDDLADFTARLKTALQTTDMAVISGGTAIGGKDFTAALIDAAGAPGTVVNGIPMRSGKPIVLGVVDGKPVVCVAGHPPEAARGFRLFAQSVIAQLMGASIPEKN
ncbi:MAG: molybdopterin molybdotransferase MoeA [Nitrospirota bacterium]|nr:molybdopterin molybdotransferase MoeA [Nitrospirota bacterium]